MMRLVSYGKLKKMMQTFKEKKLNDIDRRLLRGLFYHKLRDFDEKERDKAREVPLLKRIQLEKLKSNDLESNC